MTTTYELYTNDNGTPKLVGGKAPAIVDRVGALETSVESIQGTLNNGVVTSVNGNTGSLTPEQTGCLPLSGGTMTGNIVVSGDNRGIFQDATDKVMIIAGGTGISNGGSFYAIGGTNSTRPGYFVATARTSDVAGVQLVGKPDGTLTWGDKNIVRSVNGTSADVNGNVTISTSGGSVKRDNVINISNVNSYKAPSNGIIYIECIIAGKGYVYFYIGNTYIGNSTATYTGNSSQHGDSTTTYYLASRAFFVNKGDVITCKSRQNASSSYNMNFTGCFTPVEIG